jgi:hypothetical protein
MKITELILESADENRAIISLAQVLYRKIYNNYAISNQEIDYDTDYTDDNYGNNDYSDDSEFGNTHIDYDPGNEEKIKLGKIGDMFDSPIPALDSIRIELISDYSIHELFSNEEGHEAMGHTILGFWSSDTNTISFNADRLRDKRMETVIGHELRHALDDIKSNYKGNASTRYTTPKNPEHRKDNSMNYLAQPAEINARFTEVLHNLLPKIQNAVKLPADQQRDKLIKDLNVELQRNHISAMFPEKTQSSDYKRLLKRAWEFIQKEVDHLNSIDATHN